MNERKCGEIVYFVLKIYIPIHPVNINKNNEIIVSNSSDVK
jgi:hypothetical protein